MCFSAIPEWFQIMLTKHKYLLWVLVFQICALNFFLIAMFITNAVMVFSWGAYPELSCTTISVYICPFISTQLYVLWGSNTDVT